MVLTKITSTIWQAVKIFVVTQGILIDVFFLFFCVCVFVCSILLLACKFPEAYGTY